MKKVLIFAVITSMFSISSCKKDFTCTCTGSAAGITSSTTAVTTINDTKKKAIKTCDSKDAEATVAGFLIKTECEID